MPGPHEADLNGFSQKPGRHFKTLRPSSGHRFCRMHHYAAKSADPLGEPVFAGRKAPADETLSFRSECRPGRQAEARIAHQPLAEFKTVRNAMNLAERI